MSAALQRAADYFERLSPREQRLATIVGSLAVAFLIFMGVRTAFDSLGELDRDIGRVQQQLLNAENQIRHRESIEAQYARVAKQHSSKWSAAEIHDRLRAEIYRLAQKEPPPLNADGIAEQVTNESGELVTIPSLQQGNLTEGDQGYREYTLAFSVPASEPTDLLNFIERLQNSPQSLRVDEIELTRDPLGSKLAANIRITRTVVAGLPEAATAGTQAGGTPAAAEKSMRLNVAEWVCEGCTITAEPPEGEPVSLTFTANKPGATAFVERGMPPAAYELSTELAVSGAAHLGVADEGKVLSGAVPLREGGEPLRYTVQFRPQSTTRAALRIPFITLESEKCQVKIAYLAVRKVAD